MANDQRLPALRRDIEAALLKHLDELQRTDSERLSAIVMTQYRCLAHLAQTNRAYLRFLLDHLPMETTLGKMTAWRGVSPSCERRGVHHRRH